jgi:hypothetical protein
LQLRRSEVHGGDAREAPAVRGGLAQPEPVGVAGVPGAARPVQGPQEGGQAGSLHHLLRQGVPRHPPVLLGAIPRRVQLRQPQFPQHRPTHHQPRANRSARQELERRRLPHLQHLHLVDEQRRHQSQVGQSVIPSLALNLQINNIDRNWMGISLQEAEFQVLVRARRGPQD